MNRNFALVLDQDEAMRTLLAVTLEQEGLECVSAASVEDALQLFHEYEGRLCMVYVRGTTYRDGNRVIPVTFVREVRQSNHRIVIVGVSGGEGVIFSKLMDAGCTVCLAQPLYPEILRGIVRGARELAEK